jgi:imidazolonepropionase-like amidohydrolase
VFWGEQALERAVVFGVTTELRGRIAPGTRADLVLVKGNPAEDVLATRRILAVYKEGFQSDREGYRAKTEQERNRAGH